MPAARTCPECGAALPADAPKGLCARCALRQLLPEKTDAIASAASADTVIVAPTPDEPRSRLGDYELLEEIARGGMGIVYRARQVSLDRVVAVKTLLFGPHAGKDYVQRFRVEASAAASLQHPNIVAVHEVGVHQGQHYMVMDFVAGQTLSKISGGQPLPPRAAATYVKTIAEAIHFAHERGVLHRDLKPSNVLIDQNDEPRVTDFGLAKRFGVPPSGGAGGPAEAGTPYDDLTLSGQILGSPNYMSPEQASGTRGKVGRHSDVYSLGAILFHLLTGRPPFVAESVSETIQLVLEREPITPRVLVSGLPRDLETICLKCLQKEPAKRYATAQALAEDLGHFLNDEPIRARRVSTAEKVWRWCRRKPVIASLSAATVLLLLAVAIGAPIAAFRINQGRLHAERSLYASDMLLAQQALEGNNLGRAQKLLDRHLPARGETDLRDWEWRFLQAQCQSDELFTLGTHSNEVTTLALSTDGTMIGSASRDHSVKLWHLPSRKLLAALPHEDVVFGVAFAPDQKLITASYGGLIRFWDLSSFKQVGVITNAESIIGMALSRDGTLLAVIGRSFLKLWNLPTREEIAQVECGWCGLSVSRGLAISPDGRTLAFDQSPGSLWLWDIGERSQKRLLQGHQYWSPALAFSPDGKLLALGAWNRTAKIWDVASGALIADLTNHTGFVGSIAFSADSQTLVTGSADQNIRVWETRTWREKRTLRGHLSEVSSITLTPDGQTLVSAGKDETVRVWATSQDQKRLIEAANAEQIIGPAQIARLAMLSPDGKAAVIKHTNNTFNVWTTTPLRESSRHSPVIPSYFNPAVAPEGRTVATYQIDGTLTLWETATMRVIRILNQPKVVNDFGVYAAFSTDGKKLAAAKADNVIEVFDLAGQQPTLRLEASTAEIRYGFRFSLNDQFLLAPKGNGTALVVDVAQKRKPLLLGGHKKDVADVAVTFDSKRAITVSFDGTAKLWDLQTGTEMETISGTLLGLTAVAISPSGHRLVTGSGDGAIKLWDMDSRQEVATLKGHTGQIWGLEFQPDGESLVSVGTDAIRVWHAPISEEELKSKTNRAKNAR